MEIMTEPITYVDLHFNSEPQPVQANQARRFMILAKAFSLGIFSTTATMNDMFAIANTITDQTVTDIVTNICVAEGVYAKHVIRD